MVYTKATKYGLVPKGAMTKPSIPSFDLAKINVVQIARDLSNLLEIPQPKGWIRKWWFNKKLPMDVRRLEHIENYIHHIQMVNDSITEMQYKLFIQPKVLEDMINGYYLEAEQKIEKQLIEHRQYIKKIEEEIKRDEEETRRKKVETDKLMFEAELIGLRGDIIRKIRDKIDLDKITIEQAFVLVKALDPNASAEVNFGTMEVMVDKMKAEAELKRHQARQEGTKANVADYEFEQSKKTDKEYE